MLMTILLRILIFAGLGSTFSAVTISIKLFSYPNNIYFVLLAFKRRFPVNVYFKYSLRSLFF